MKNMRNAIAMIKEFQAPDPNFSNPYVFSYFNIPNEKTNNGRGQRKI